MEKNKIGKNTIWPKITLKEEKVMRGKKVQKSKKKGLNLRGKRKKSKKKFGEKNWIDKALETWKKLNLSFSGFRSSAFLNLGAFNQVNLGGDLTP